MSVKYFTRWGPRSRNYLKFWRKGTRRVYFFFLLNLSPCLSFLDSRIHKERCNAARKFINPIQCRGTLLALIYIGETANNWSRFSARHGILYSRIPPCESCRPTKDRAGAPADEVNKNRWSVAGTGRSIDLFHKGSISALVESRRAAGIDREKDKEAVFQRRPELMYISSKTARSRETNATAGD